MNRTDVSVVSLTIIFSFRILHTVSLEKMADKYLTYIENESIVDKVELFESMLQQSMLFSVYLIRWIIRTWSINICTLFSGTEGLIQPDEDLCRQASILWWCQDITPATTALLWRDRAYLPKNKCSPQVGSEQSQPPPRKGGVRPHRLPAEAAEGPEGDLGEGVERCHRRSDEDIGAGGAR